MMENWLGEGRRNMRGFIKVTGSVSLGQFCNRSRTGWEKVRFEGLSKGNVSLIICFLKKIISWSWIYWTKSDGEFEVEDDGIESKWHKVSITGETTRDFLVGEGMESEKLKTTKETNHAREESICVLVKEWRKTVDFKAEEDGVINYYGKRRNKTREPWITIDRPISKMRIRNRRSGYLSFEVHLYLKTVKTNNY